LRINEKKKQLKRRKKQRKSPIRLISILLFSFGFLLFANTLNHEYALDDYSVIKENTIVTKGLESIPVIFSNPYRFGYQNYKGNLYRPLPVSIFTLEWAISPDNPAFGHWVNVLLYAFCGSLLFLVLIKILPGKSVLLPLFTSILFIAHPIHTEVVANIKSLDEILTLLFFLLTIRFLWKYLDNPSRVKWLIGSTAAYFFALLSKESAITFLAIFPLMLYFFTKRKGLEILKLSAFFLIPAIIFLGIRIALVGGFFEGTQVSLLDNCLVGGEDIGTKTASTFLFIGKYFQSLFFPLELTSDLGYNQIPLTHFGDWKVILTLVFILGFLFFAIRNFGKKSLPSFGILFFAITFSISTNLIFTIGTNYGERLLFIPSLGFTILVAWALLKLLKHTDNQALGFGLLKNNILFSLSFFVIIAFYVFQTINRNSDWKNNFTLYSADIKKAPNSARVNYQYGHELAKLSEKTAIPDGGKEFKEKAYTHFQKAIEIYPEYPDALALIGIFHYQNGHSEKALEYYQKALEYNPGDMKLHTNIGKVHVELSNVHDAEKSFLKAVELAPNMHSTYLNLGVFYAKYGDFEGALIQFQEALKLKPENTSLKTLVEQTRQKLNNPQ